MRKAEQIKGMYEQIEAWLMAWNERHTYDQDRVDYNFLDDNERTPEGLMNTLSQCIDQINKVDGALGKTLQEAWGCRDEEALAQEMDRNRLVLGKGFREQEDRMREAATRLFDLIGEYRRDGNLLFDGKINAAAFSSDSTLLVSRLLGRMFSFKTPYLFEGELELVHQGIQRGVIPAQENVVPYFHRFGHPD